jgi:hypothetical protein
MVLSGSPTGDRAAVSAAVAQKPVLVALASYIRRTFQRNADHRRISGVDDMLLKCLRMVKCEYEPGELAAFAAKGAPVVYSPVADTKRRAAMAMIGEIFNNPGDKPWSLKPSPKPDVPQSVIVKAVQETMKDWLELVVMTGKPPPAEVVAEYAKTKVDEINVIEKEWAKVRAVRMETKVHDQFIEGGWLDAFDDYRNHICTYGTGLIKGPVPRMRKRKVLKETEYGTVTYEMQDKVVLEFEAVSPWDCFPSPAAKKIGDGAFCQRVRFTPETLRNFSGGGQAWRKDAVDKILELNAEGGIRESQPYDIMRRQMENDGIENGGDCVLEGIEFFGEVRGSMLLALGMVKTSDKRIIKAKEYYEVDAITVLDEVLYCRVIDQELGRPLSKGVFYKAPDSWWGESPVIKMETTQKVCNASLRDLIVNMAQASGPQTVIKDIARLHPSCSVQQSPWKVWLFQNSMTPTNQVDNPIYMFNPQSNSKELTAVFDWALKQADTDTGIPAYTYGSNISAGAARTASGLAILTEAASRGMKMVVNTTDKDVIRDCVKRTADYDLLYDTDESIKGDVEVNPSGVMGLILREQESARLTQALQLTANPIDMQIIGASGRAALLRRKVLELDINPDDVIPSPEKLKEIDEINRVKEAMQMEAQAAKQQVTQAPGQPQVENTLQNPEQTAMRGQTAEGGMAA